MSEKKEKLQHNMGGEASVHEEKALPELQRRLKSRHLQMIAIGGTIGTGLFIGSGGAIAKSGPAGALIAYIFIGSIVYSVMMSLGEMATYIPVSGSFTVYASRFVDPSLGFAMGWLYWFSWAVTFALELTATGLIIKYWNDELSIAIFISIFWVLITGLNLLPVSFYGEIEFWFSSIKVMTVIGFLIFAICINAGAGQQGYLGFTYWKDPGAFAGHKIEPKDSSLSIFVGFWAVLIQAGFSYQGTELVGIAAGETENPRKNVPAAIKKTFYRILFFFVFTVFFLGLLIPYDNKNLLNDTQDASSSPFVIAVQLAGVKTLPGIINAVLLSVVLSAANSNVYSGSRILVGLSQEGAAPKWMALTTAKGVPYIAVLATSVVGFLAFLNLGKSSGEVFNWLLNISSVAGFISWTVILICHVRFMRCLKSRGIDRNTLPYKANWQPYYSYFGIFFNVLIILTQGFESFMPFKVEEFFVSYVSLMLFVVLFVGHKLMFRTRMWRKEEVDIKTGCIELDDTVWEEHTPTTTVGKFMSWLC
ncbi:amino acid permease [Ascobolus immersus RN42]|uniref:Amino acid permease n=1 Tax=Ascobolus immersus RN42 TaxID=1160509 RepID=A0A3N4I800_ASCIM|nr:amino acid permease [Ascobolus immersus RN42]